MTYKEIYNNVLNLITSSLRRRLIVFVGLSILAVLFEVLSLASLYPFLSALIGEEVTFINTIAQNLSFPPPKPVDLAIIFSLMIIMGFIVRLYVLRLGLKLSAQVGTELSVRLVTCLLSNSFESFSSKQSGELIAVATTKINSLVFGVVTPFLNLIASALIISGVLVMLLSVNVLVTLLVMGFIMFCYGIVSIIVRKKVKFISKEVARDQGSAVLKLQEMFGAIREIVLASVQDRYVNEYQTVDGRMRINSSMSQFIASSPRYFIELVILLSVVIISTTYINTQNDFEKVLPMAGVYILALQKLLPLVQQVFSAKTTIRSNQIAASEVLSAMTCNASEERNIETTNKKLIAENHITIKLENCSFQYANASHKTLKECSLQISTGEHIGIIGRTGSGKSTIVDILASLLEPSSGNITLNGTDISMLDRSDYRKLFAFVPQRIFIKDGTILDNIIFPNSKDCVSKNSLDQALKKSHLTDLVNRSNQGLSHRVGENGNLLSGGQRQRIAIARALYSGARILILDEATSALDKETERAVYSDIRTLNDSIGVISIAHKESILDSCDRIYSIEDGTITRVR